MSTKAISWKCIHVFDVTTLCLWNLYMRERERERESCLNYACIRLGTYTYGIKYFCLIRVQCNAIKINFARLFFYLQDDDWKSHEFVFDRIEFTANTITLNLAFIRVIIQWLLYSLKWFARGRQLICLYSNNLLLHEDGWKCQ